ncbi:BREX system ATP-binding domain-containing protein [Aeromonas hydrophila]|uniref:BREX system ATP-binding domain-containing protein n=1 Tax=Aeromonas hydrophila TaxID=644 RepID=UPI003BC18647
MPLQVNLYKLNSSQARTSNYEQILRILNDCLQGSAEHLGFLLGGTPEFLLDPRKSYCQIWCMGSGGIPV